MEKIYSLVRKIPKGKVSSYGIVAKKLKLHPRFIGRIMNKNKNKDVPCHRIVLNSGFVGGFNKGINKKISLLRKEGLKIKRNKILDFKEVLFKF